MTVAVGDSLTGIRQINALPAGTIVGFMHPIYQGATAAVRVVINDGSLHWAVSGVYGLKKTKEIRESYGQCPFVVLRLPDETLNAEVRIGYRRFGKAPVQ